MAWHAKLGNYAPWAFCGSLFSVRFGRILEIHHFSNCLLNFKLCVKKHKSCLKIHFAAEFLKSHLFVHFNVEAV